MVWKFEVTWSNRAKPKRLLAAARRVVRPRSRGTAPGSRARSTKRKVVSPNGVVIENIAQRAAVVREALDVVDRRAAALVEQRGTSRSMSSTSKTSVPTPSGCLRR